MQNLKKRSLLFFGDPIIKQVLSLLLSTFISQLILQWFQNKLHVGLVINFVFLWHTEKFIISWSVLMMLALCLWALFNNAKVVNVLMIGSSTVVGFLTYEKMTQREEPLYPADFKMALEIDFLLKMVSPVAVVVILAAFTLIVLFMICLFKSGSVKISTPVRLVLFVVTSLGLFYTSQFQEPGNLIKRAYDRTAKWIPYSQKMNYYNTGFVAGFLYNLPSDPMVKPENVDKVELAALLTKYQAVADEINVQRANEQVESNIIYIMNESFADPLVLNRADVAFDPIPFTRKLAESVRSGTMLSQGYGGGTANIEFEALTGFSMEPFAVNISTPFTQFLPKMTHFPSIVSRMKDQGHATFAMHPFDTSMYKRRDNYQILGFEQFYYDETMTYQDKVDYNPYISDASAYKEIIAHMKQSEGYDFAHLVTMQNHTPFKGKYMNPPTFQDTGFVNEEINQYHRDLMESDRAMAQLVSALEEWEEPVAVVFWGDHWPSVFGEALKRENGDLLSRTPALIFGNQQFAANKWDIVSPIYFMPELWEAMDTKVTPFEALLMTLREELPAFEKGMYYLSDGSFVQTREELPESARAVLKEYDGVMYDTTTGSQQLEESGFFEVD